MYFLKLWAKAHILIDFYPSAKADGN